MDWRIRIQGTKYQLKQRILLSKHRWQFWSHKRFQHEISENIFLKTFFTCYFVWKKSETLKKWSGPGSWFVLDPYENDMDLKHRFNNHYFPLPVSIYRTTLFCEVIRVSNRNSVARNCAQVFLYCAELCEIARKLHFTQLRTSKIHCVGNPRSIYLY